MCIRDSPWEAQMNVRADHLATDHLDFDSESSERVPFITPSKASLTIQGKTITRRFAQRLRQTASGPNLRKRMILQNNWSERTFKEINWAVPGKALQTLEHSARIFIIKFAHEHLPTRKHMMRIGKAETDQCPSCQHIVETSWHILSCPNRSIWRKSLTTRLDDILRITNT